MELLNQSTTEQTPKPSSVETHVSSELTSLLFKLNEIVTRLANYVQKVEPLPLRYELAEFVSGIVDNRYIENLQEAISGMIRIEMLFILNSTRRYGTNNSVRNSSK